MQGYNGHHRTQAVESDPKQDRFYNVLFFKTVGISSVWKFKNFRYHLEEPLGIIFCRMNGLNLGEILFSGPWNGFINITENIKTKCTNRE